MTNDGVLQALEEHHRTIRAGISEIRKHCEAGCVDSAGLHGARLALIEASRARSTFIADMVVPMLLERADEAQQDKLSALLCTCTAKRRVSVGHIGVWTPTTIAQDPAGYHSAARSIWAMMQDQMGLGWRTLAPYLRNIR